MPARVWCVLYRHIDLQPDSRNARWQAGGSSLPAFNR